MRRSRSKCPWLASIREACSSCPYQKLGVSGKSAVGGSEPLRLDDVERSAILKVLKDTNGDKIAAARALGIGKPTIYGKLKEYGLVGGANRL